MHQCTVLQHGFWCIFFYSDCLPYGPATWHFVAACFAVRRPGIYTAFSYSSHFPYKDLPFITSKCRCFYTVLLIDGQIKYKNR